MNKKLEIIQYTDPMCIWCLALEPNMRKIEYLIPNQVEFKNIMGLLVDDVHKIIGNDIFSKVRFQQLKAKMKEHFFDASYRSGMPVDPSFLDKIVEGDVTSYPMNLAYKAMQLQDEISANKYLRRMREAAHTECKIMAHDENIFAVASEFKINMEQFMKDYKNGNAEQELNKDLKKSQEDGIRSFPTILMKYGDKKIWIQGYHEFSYFKDAIEKLTDGEIKLNTKEFSLENLVDYVVKYGKVAAKEIQVAFDLEDDKLTSAIEELLETGMFAKVVRGNGYFIELKDIAICDTENGICNY